MKHRIKMRRTEIHPVLGGKCSIFRTTVSGDIWQFQMWLPNEKKWLRKSLRTTIRQEAEALAEKQWTETIGKITVGMKIFSISAKELVEKYLADLEERVKQGLNRESTLHLRRSWLQHYLTFIGQNTKVQSVPPEKFETFLRWHRSQQPTPSLQYTKGHQTLMMIMYRWAVNKKLLPAELLPKFSKVQVPKGQGKRQGMNEHEYKMIMEVSKRWHTKTTNPNEQYERKQLHNFILLQGWYGTRTCETLGLRWKDVTFGKDDTAVLNIREETTKRNKNRKVTGTRKDVFERVRSYSRHTNPDDHIFSSYRDGKRWSPYRKWCELRGEVKEKYPNFNPNITLYDLRHFWISSRLRIGESPWAISRYVGNSPEMITKHYDNVTDDQVGKSIISKRLHFKDDEVFAVPVKKGEPR